MLPYMTVWFVLSLPFACFHEPCAVPTNWREIGNPNLFTCEIPAELQKMPGQSYDSYAEFYLGRGIQVVFDYGWYCPALPADDLRFWNNTENISGRPATTAIQNKPAQWTPQYGEYAYMMAVRFEDVGRGQNKLYLTVFYSQPDDIETALRVIRSIKIA